MTDFYCPSEKLVIEPDGAEHYTPAGSDYDDEKNNFIRGLGIKILRITGFAIILMRFWRV